jgi:hypothetical protein
MADMDANPYKAPDLDRFDRQAQRRERIPRDAIVNAVMASFWLLPLLVVLAAAAFRMLWRSG